MKWSDLLCVRTFLGEIETSTILGLVSYCPVHLQLPFQLVRFLQSYTSYTYLTPPPTNRFYSAEPPEFVNAMVRCLNGAGARARRIPLGPVGKQLLYATADKEMKDDIAFQHEVAEQVNIQYLFLGRLGS